MSAYSSGCPGSPVEYQYTYGSSTFGERHWLPSTAASSGLSSPSRMHDDAFSSHVPTLAAPSPEPGGGKDDRLSVSHAAPMLPVGLVAYDLAIRDAEARFDETRRLAAANAALREELAEARATHDEEIAAYTEREARLTSAMSETRVRRRALLTAWRRGRPVVRVVAIPSS